MPRFGLIYMYGEDNKVFFKYEGTVDSYTDPEICHVLRFWNCSMQSTIMVPCLIERDRHNEIRVSLPKEMVNTFNCVKMESNVLDSIEAPAEISHDDVQCEDIARKHELFFAEIRILSNRSKILHKDDYPFVISAFAAQGLRQTPLDSVLFYSRRIGLFLLKKSVVVGSEGCVDQYIRGIVTSSNNFSYLQGVPQPESAKSVKIVKTAEIIFKGCALLGYIDSPADRDKAERWIGWNDYTGLLSFDFACPRLLKQKHRDFDPRCAFVMFSATLTKNGKWKAREVSYSRQEIVEHESQMPLDISFVDGLVVKHTSIQEVTLVSNTVKTSQNEELVVVCNRIHFDSSDRPDKTTYGGIIVPIYSKNGTKVGFEALAVLPNYKWADPSTQWHRLAAILPTWEEHELPHVTETSFFLNVPMQKGSI